jgi:hypothetical protein
MRVPNPCILVLRGMQNEGESATVHADLAAAALGHKDIL